MPHNGDTLDSMIWRAPRALEYPRASMPTLPATNDRNRFFERDPIATAEDNGSTPTQGFRASSRSLRDARISPRQNAHKVRVPGMARPTGGAGQNANSRGMGTTWGKADRDAIRRERSMAGTARKREAIVAELRARGYAV